MPPTEPEDETPSDTVDEETFPITVEDAEAAVENIVTEEDTFSEAFDLA